MSNGRFCKAQNENSAKHLVETAVEDKTRPNYWALSAAWFCPSLVPKKSNQEEQQEEKCAMGSIISSQWSCPPVSGLKDTWVSGQCPAVAWESLIIYESHIRDSVADTVCSTFILLTPWLAFFAPLCMPLFTLVLQVRAEPVILLVNGALWITSSSCFHVGNTKKSLSFPRYCMSWATYAKED